MAIKEWTIETPVRHVIRLEHGYWSGKVTISVDEKPTVIDDGFEHRFDVDGMPFLIDVKTSGLGGLSFFMTSFQTLQISKK